MGGAGSRARAPRAETAGRADFGERLAPPDGFPVAAAVLTDALMDALVEAVLVRDPDGVVLGCNAAAERIFGVGADRLVGTRPGERPCRIVRYGGGAVAPGELPSSRTLGTGRPVERDVLGIAGPGGSTRWLAVSSRGLFLQGEERPYAVVVSAMDVTEQVSALERIRAGEAELAAAQRIAGVGSWRWDPALGRVEMSSALRDLLGLRADAAAFGVDELLELLRPEGESPVELQRRLTDVAVGGRLDVEVALRRPDGATTVLQIRAEPAAGDGRGGAGPAAGGQLRGTALDVTRLRAAERELREREAQLRALLDASPDPILRFDTELRVVSANAEARRVLGHDPRMDDGRALMDRVCSRSDRARWRSALRRVSETARPGELEMEVDGSDGRRWFEVRLAPETAPDGSVTHVVAVGRDVTERRRRAVSLAHDVVHDPLTGLANRRGLLDAVGRVAARRNRRGFALLLLDLDRFKVVNDTLGHRAGDTLLATVARRLRSALRPEDLLARLGGDEFAVLLDVVGDAGEVAGVATRLRTALAEPVDVDGHLVTTSASVGVVVAAPGGSSPDELLARADAAMYLAKARGRGRTEFFDDELRARVEHRASEEARLRQAVAAGELVVHYQPEVDLMTGHVVGVEALARWARPGGTVLPAAAFVGLAHETGLIGELGTHVLREASAQAGRWRAADRPVPVRVNVAERQLSRPEFPALVLDALEAGAARPVDLALEVGESVLSDAPEAVRENLERLRAAGVRCVVDDFGAGASSLPSLARIRPALLKLDRSLVAGFVDDPTQRALVEGVLALAARLGLPVTAMGVETVAQAELLRLFGCSGAQGHLFGRPGPAADLERALARR